MLRAYAFESESPASVFRSLDRVLVEGGHEQFATCCFARFEPWSRTMEIANAGHPPPVHIAPGRPPEVLAVPPSPLLGAGGEPHDLHLRMAAGSRLVFYTDGLVERRTRSIDDGIAAVIATLRNAPDDLDEMCELLIDATSDGPRQDDTCVLAVAFGGAGRRVRSGARRRRLRS